jgi:Ca2+-binding EF-hand superfamily protein
MLLEKYEFHAEELDHLFNWIDIKKDNVIDIDEFTAKYYYTIKPLNIMKNIIHNNKLDIEDLAHRMKIDIEEIKNFDYPEFLEHVKRLDYTLPESFIRKIFDELKQKDKKPEKNLFNQKNF